jgi:hypothetical protein
METYTRLIFSSENYNFMSLANLNTKRERNALVKSAGKYFVGEASDIIKELNSQGESAFLGIQKKLMI